MQRGEVLQVGEDTTCHGRTSADTKRTTYHLRLYEHPAYKDVRCGQRPVVAFKYPVGEALQDDVPLHPKRPTVWVQLKVNDGHVT